MLKLQGHPDLHVAVVRVGRVDEADAFGGWAGRRLVQHERGEVAAAENNVVARFAACARCRQPHTVGPASHAWVRVQTQASASMARTAPRVQLLCSSSAGAGRRRCSVRQVRVRGKSVCRQRAHDALELEAHEVCGWLRHQHC